MLVTSVDTDGDTLSDYDEVMIYGTNPKVKDKEIVDQILQNPSLLGNVVNELQLWNNPFQDRDGDRISDRVEYSLNTDYNKYDTDNDGLGDGEELRKGLPVLEKHILPLQDCLDCIMEVKGKKDAQFSMQFNEDSLTIRLDNANLSIGDLIELKQEKEKEAIINLIKNEETYEIEAEKAILEFNADTFKEQIKNPSKATIHLEEGYPKDWIDKRLRGIAIRQNLTDEWRERGIQEQKDFAILTAEISKATFGMTPTEYKKYKQLPKQSKANLRDHMNDLELIFTMLGERVTTELSQDEKPDSFTKSKDVAKRGGKQQKMLERQLKGN